MSLPLYFVRRLHGTSVRMAETKSVCPATARTKGGERFIRDATNRCNCRVAGIELRSRAQEQIITLLPERRLLSATRGADPDFTNRLKIRCGSKVEMFLHAVRSARHSLMRHYLASRPAIKAALRRPRRGLDGASPRCKGYSQIREWRALFWRFRTRGRHFYFAREATFLLCRDTNALSS